METEQIEKYKKNLDFKKNLKQNPLIKVFMPVERFVKLDIIRPVMDSFYCMRRTVHWNQIMRGTVKRNENELALEELRDSHKGETAFIIGNGPSLHAEDLDLLHSYGAYSFGCNRIGLIFEETDWRPDCYAAIDRKLLFSDTFVEDMLHKEHCDYYFFGKKLFECMPPELKQKNTLYIEQKPTNPYKVEKDFSAEPEKYLISGYTVTNLSIQMAVFMGFTTICLLGIDCKYAYVADAKGNIVHDERVKETYFKVKDVTANQNSAFVDGMMQAYVTAKKYAEAHGLKIYNCSKDSVLELFERRDLREVLEESKNRLHEQGGTSAGIL